MTSNINDGYPTKFVDPLSDSFANFDFEAVYQALDPATGAEGDNSRAAEVVAAVLGLLLAGTHGDRINPKAVGLRLIGIAWVLNPASFPGVPSLTSLAARCGVSPAALAKHTAEASRLLNWRNRAQRHAWNFQPHQDDPANN